MMPAMSEAVVSAVAARQGRRLMTSLAVALSACSRCWGMTARVSSGALPNAAVASAGVATSWGGSAASRLWRRRERGRRCFALGETNSGGQVRDERLVALAVAHPVDEAGNKEGG
jgi:hypothetical protein